METAKVNINKLATVVLFGIILCTSANSSADISRGKALYENHCRECHTPIVHKREHKLADSYTSLGAWVMSWIVHSNLDWQQEDIVDITLYLNHRFYNYPTQ